MPYYYNAGVLNPNAVQPKGEGKLSPYFYERVIQLATDTQ